MFSSSKIKSIAAREILDSRGNPTLACRLTLRSGVSAEAEVPSGASTGVHEALELRDGGKRYGGLGVLRAVKNVNEIIAPTLIGIDASRQQDIDHVMIELDGTTNKSRLGANAILGVSLACAQAMAMERKIPLWKSLRETFLFVRKASMPQETMNVLNGGAHAGWVMDIQEIMLVPQQKTLAERMRVGAEVFHALKKNLARKHLPLGVGDEGGFAERLPHVERGFDLLIDAIKEAGYHAGRDVRLACDVASSEFYDPKTHYYRMNVEGKSYTAGQLLARYQKWQEKYPLESIEDPFDEDDWDAWKMAFPVLKKKSVIVGDDLFVTNLSRLQRGVREHVANAILIKFNQIGTLTETVDAILYAQSAGWKTSISHRSGETGDTTIADLAVACGCEYIKTGSLSRSERIEKYNRLLEIELEMAGKR